MSSWRLVIDNAIGGPAAIDSRPASRPRRRARRPGTTAFTNPTSSAACAAHHLRRERELLRLVHADALAQQPRRPEVEAQARAWRRSPRSARDPSTRSCRRPARGRGPHRRTRRRPWRSPGTGQPCTASTDVAEHAHRVEVGPAGVGAAAAASTATPPRSAPAQKSPPAPVSTTARVPEKLISRNAAPIATHMSPVHAFFASGRSIVTVVTWSSRSTRRFGYCARSSFGCRHRRVLLALRCRRFDDTQNV